MITRSVTKNSIASLSARGYATWGHVVLAALALIALAAPLVSPYDPNLQFNGMQLVPAGTAGHLLGTDELSRDILSRTIYGTRISIGVGVVSVLVGAFFGILSGVIAATAHPLIGGLIMRICDFLLAIPGVLLGILVVSLIGAGTMQVCVAIAIINLPDFARLIRASTLREKNLDYVRAARAQGAAYSRILFHHLLPNALPTTLGQLPASIGQAILLEAGLSFLGLGVQAPTASWGAMLSKSRDYLALSPFYALVPGLLLFIFVLALNKVSDRH
ncbi:ABC transporter permease [Brucella pseudogrignonensis]|uniref:ABC transporter permease n=1 Tax=Brucella pseudogrignonensis TaxID=419475 RepID=UPI0038B4E6E5